MVMEVDEPAGTSMDTSEPLEPAIEWRFSQVKGNIEGDDTHTEGKFFFRFKRLFLERAPSALLISPRPPALLSNVFCAQLTSFRAWSSPMTANTWRLATKVDA